MPSNASPPQPPGAADIRRELRLHRSQWIGIPLLILLPLLGLFEVFGERRSSVEARAKDVLLAVEFPTRNRYRMVNELRVGVTNTTARVLDSVTVDVDTAYASRFSSALAIPAFEHPYRVQLSGVQPGETRLVQVELEGDAYGRHSGEVRVSAGSDTARVRLHTFISP